MIVDRLGRGVVEVAQAVGAQCMVGRVKRLRRIHQLGLLCRVRQCCRSYESIAHYSRKAPKAREMTRKQEMNTRVRRLVGVTAVVTMTWPENAVSRRPVLPGHAREPHRLNHATSRR